MGVSISPTIEPFWKRAGSSSRPSILMTPWFQMRCKNCSNVGTPYRTKNGTCFMLWMDFAVINTEILLATSTPVTHLISDLREVKYVYRLRGEKWGVGLTEILRRYPFPEFTKTGYIPEGIVWLDIAKNFKSRAINEVVQFYYIDDAQPGVTTMRKKIWMPTPPVAGITTFGFSITTSSISLMLRWHLSRLQPCCPLSAGSRNKQFKVALTALKRPQARLLVVATLPFSVLLYLINKFKRL